MDEHMTRAKFLATMQLEHDRWNALLEEVGRERMEQPGVEGEWPVRDIIVHVMAWERYVAILLRGALRGEKPARIELYGQPIPDEVEQSDGSDMFNAWVVERNRERPLDDILADAEESFQLLLRATGEFSEEELTDPQRVFPGLEWPSPKPLWYILSRQSYVHYWSHTQPIRDWLNLSKGG
jgi:hypothetical protein